MRNGSQEDLLVEEYSDIDLASNKEGQKSNFNFIFMLNRRYVNWCSKK